MTRAYKVFDWAGLRVSGPDRVAWLNGLLTCDVAAASSERSVWGLLLQKQGKIQAEVVVIATAEELILGVRGGDAAAACATLDQYLVMEDAEIEVINEPLRWVLLVSDDSELATKQSVGALPGLSWLGRGFWLDPRAAGGGPDAASGAVGSPGSSLPREWSMSSPLALCSVGRDELPELERQLDDWGRPLAEEQWDELRVVWGVPDFERDFFPVDKPHEASLERRAVDWKKGCYLGQEVVCMQDMRGKVKRRLVRLELDASNLPRSAQDGALAVLSESGEQVGQITTRSPSGAIASVKAPFYEVGTPLCAEDLVGRVRQLGPARPS